jgi:outer membrane protein TolC
MRQGLFRAVALAMLSASSPAAAEVPRVLTLAVSTGPIVLTLSDSVARALDAATAVLKAQIADRLAAEQLLQGYAQFLPNFDAAGGYSKARGLTYVTVGPPTLIDSRNRGYNYQLTSVLNLFSGFSDYGSFKNVLAGRKAAAQTLERSRQEIVFDVAQAYLQVQLDDRRSRHGHRR